MDRKEYLRNYQREWMKKRRQEWIDANGPCVKCGSSVDLEVDHIDRSQKTMNASAVWSRREEIRLAELEKCQVLCAKCHQEKTTEEFKTVKHGTYAMRNRWKCKCDECMEYVRRSRAELRKKSNGV